MKNIQTSPFPLAFPLADAKRGRSDHRPGRIDIRTFARALEGLQKVALVQTGDRTWHMVCDEGPYLNGTDLAPFPLAFFATGLVIVIWPRSSRSLKRKTCQSTGSRSSRKISTRWKVRPSVAT